MGNANNPRDASSIVTNWARGPVLGAGLPGEAMKSAELSQRDLEARAMVLATAIGDFRRFDHPGKLMAYVRLVPSEHSSG